MNEPFFFEPQVETHNKTVLLNAASSKHCIQVLRCKKGDAVRLTNGKGLVCQAVILKPDKSNCLLQIVETVQEPLPTNTVSIAVSLIKNPARLEWLVEKATEIGVAKIIPLHCARTEKQQFRKDRIYNIAVSAMLQSQQAWLPVIEELTSFEKFLEKESAAHKLIAHCHASEKTLLTSYSLSSLPTLIAIGPEGDFTIQEVEKALQHHFKPVSLGNHRLRTETAAIVALTLLSYNNL